MASSQPSTDGLLEPRSTIDISQLLSVELSEQEPYEQPEMGMEINGRWAPPLVPTSQSGPLDFIPFGGSPPIFRPKVKKGRPKGATKKPERPQEFDPIYGPNGHGGYYGGNNGYNMNVFDRNPSFNPLTHLSWMDMQNPFPELSGPFMSGFQPLTNYVKTPKAAKKPKLATTPKLAPPNNNSPIQNGRFDKPRILKKKKPSTVTSNSLAPTVFNQNGLTITMGPAAPEVDLPNGFSLPPDLSLTPLQYNGGNENMVVEVNPAALMGQKPKKLKKKKRAMGDMNGMSLQHMQVMNPMDNPAGPSFIPGYSVTEAQFAQAFGGANVDDDDLVVPIAPGTGAMVMGPNGMLQKPKKKMISQNMKTGIYIRDFKNRENIYGAVPDVKVGQMFRTRWECCLTMVHRMSMAGIHGGPEGCYSIAVSAFYDDDVDNGSSLVYTGEGGRNLKGGDPDNPKSLRVAPHSKDQTLTKGNLALYKSITSKRPVRVIRSSKLQSQYAPHEEGYRYDGLYNVTKCWVDDGMGGYKVYKFLLERCADQDPAPWELPDWKPKQVRLGKKEFRKDAISVSDVPNGDGPPMMFDPELERKLADLITNHPINTGSNETFNLTDETESVFNGVRIKEEPGLEPRSVKSPDLHPAVRVKQEPRDTTEPDSDSNPFPPIRIKDEPVDPTEDDSNDCAPFLEPEVQLDEEPNSDAESSEPELERSGPRIYPTVQYGSSSSEDENEPPRLGAATPLVEFDSGKMASFDDGEITIEPVVASY